MSQKSDVILERVLDDLQFVIDRAKEQGKSAEVLAAATAQAELVGLLDDPVDGLPSIEWLANAAERLVADNIERFSLAERSRLIALLRDKVGHIERECCS